MTNYAAGLPTKEFFVEMLTRDIELHDAILDLLDNCLDGVIRQQGGKKLRNSTDFYSGFYANILICKDGFSIEDNCGGIPRVTAEEYAFRMGRSPDKKDDNLPTVGIYGIGMKRAIFKIGREARVITRNDGKLYQVLIPSSWVSKDDKDWDFPISDLTEPDLLHGGGTKVDITELNPLIAESWLTADKVDLFVDRLIKATRQCYSFIIQRGFQITINGNLVKPLDIQLLLSTNNNGPRISPYVFRQTYDDVKVNLVVGFYAPPPSPEDIDDENNLRRSSSDAGWTVLCNDRVVLYNDKSHITGWGEAGVPQYHNQFIGIRGIVIFESNNPRNLPMTTTKRGIDTSSRVYAAVKDKMRYGLKLFTDYTNRWKGQNEREREYSSIAIPVSVGEIFEAAGKTGSEYSITMRAGKDGSSYKPILPSPPNDKPYKIIRYSKDIEAIRDITEFLFNDREHSVPPSKVGEICFDRVLAEAQKL